MKREENIGVGYDAVRGQHWFTGVGYVSKDGTMLPW
jgi:hypothetical protein